MLVEFGGRCRKASLGVCDNYCCRLKSVPQVCDSDCCRLKSGQQVCDSDCCRLKSGQQVCDSDCCRLKSVPQVCDSDVTIPLPGRHSIGSTRCNIISEKQFQSSVSGATTTRQSPLIYAPNCLAVADTDVSLSNIPTARNMRQKQDWLLVNSFNATVLVMSTRILSICQRS